MEDYLEKRRKLQGEKGSQFIIKAILSREDERASYSYIEDYTEGYGTVPQEELEPKLHALQAFNMIASDTERILGEESDETYFYLTEEGEEFLREDLPDYDRYRWMLKELNRFSD